MSIATATELWRKSATELAQAIGTLQASSVEVVEAHLRRIEAVNPSIKAVVIVLGEGHADRRHGSNGPRAGRRGGRRRSPGCRSFSVRPSLYAALARCFVRPNRGCWPDPGVGDVRPCHTLRKRSDRGTATGVSSPPLAGPVAAGVRVPTPTAARHVAGTDVTFPA